MPQNYTELPSQGYFTTHYQLTKFGNLSTNGLGIEAQLGGIFPT